LDLLSLETLQAIAHHYGYWAIFFGILLENMGIPLPGETITLVGGFLAGSGELHYGVVLISAITGAVLGDNCGYWLGRWGGWPLLCRVAEVFRIPEAQLQAVRQQFSQNAAKAVLLGRFVTFLRIFAGPLAGIAQMPYPLFALCNITGASLWAIAIVSLAFGLGRIVPLPQLVAWVAQLGIFAFLAVVLWLVLPRWLVAHSRNKKLTH
jgi:membrane protein DedA with SNARE-associated domain